MSLPLSLAITITYSVLAQSGFLGSFPLGFLALSVTFDSGMKERFVSSFLSIGLPLGDKTVPSDSRTSCRTKNRLYPTGPGSFCVAKQNLGVN